MTNEQIIHDLQAFADYFREERGVEPLCFSEAIRVITSQQKRIIRDKAHLDANEKETSERQQGTWKISGKGYRGKTQDYACLQCSECGRRISYVHLEWSEDSFDEGLAKFLMKYPYCNCGAKMEGVVDEVN